MKANFKLGQQHGYKRARELTQDERLYCVEFLRDQVWELTGTLPWDLFPSLMEYDPDTTADEIIHDLDLQEPEQFLRGAVRGVAAYWWNTTGKLYDLGLAAPVDAGE